jgi:DNA-binding SARP family transcriptional activator
MIDLQLLGGLDIVGPDLSPNSRARRRHPMVLLAVVAASAPQPVSRDRLMALLWPESDTDRASNSLRQALHALRRELGDDLFLPEMTGGIRLDPDKVKVDLWTFRAAMARGDYEEAVAAHSGPLLDGVHLAQLAELMRWLDAERGVVERAFVDALDALAREAEEQGRRSDAIAWARRSAAADPCSSRAALALMRALAAGGDRSGALAFAAVHENFLRAHLETEPDAAVAAFVELLRRDTPPAGIAVVRAASSDEPHADTTAVTLAAPRANASPDATVPAHVVPRAIRLPLHRLRRRSRMFAIAAGTVGLVGVGATYSIVRPENTELVLTSGAVEIAGRDTADMLLACSGPACPPGRLPQAAFVVAKSTAYAVPPEASAYIAQVSNGTTITDPGYKCCTTAVFERVFVLPKNAEYGIVTIGVLADNQAIVEMNGIEFGRQPRISQEGNFAGRASMFATTFLPDPSGINRLRVTLWDGGGVLGLNFRAFVRYSRSKPADSSVGR